MFHCMQNFTFLQTVITSILIGGSPSNARALLADLKQAWPEELGRLAFTASHLVALKVATEMIAYLKTQTAFPRNIYTMDLKFLITALKECCHVKKPIHVLLIQFTPVAAGIARTDLFDRIE